MSDKFYYKDGSILEHNDYSKILHREDGPAVEWADGEKWWYFNDIRHRVDGPAIDYNGYQSWWINGKLHRVDGPAIEHANGTKSWCINGQYLTEEEFNNHPKVCDHKFQILLEEVLSGE